MKNLLLVIIILFSCKSISQNNFQLKSSEDSITIKYANIYSNNILITSTDTLGYFSVSDKYINTNIKITALGYKTLNDVQLKSQSTIFMEVDVIVLNEVIVSNQNKSKKKYKLGKAKSGNAGLVCTFGDKTISQVAKFFQNKNENTTFLEKIKFKSFCSDKNRVLSIFVYSVDNDGMPYKILNNEAIICNLKKGHNTYEINLNQFNINFPENGVYISLNYILIEQNKCFGKFNKDWYYYEPSIDVNRTDNYIDTWYNVNDVWKKSETYSLNMELILID